MAIHALQLIHHLTICRRATNGTINEALFQVFIVSKKLSQKEHQVLLPHGLISQKYILSEKDKKLKMFHKICWF